MSVYFLVSPVQNHTTPCICGVENAFIDLFSRRSNCNIKFVFKQRQKANFGGMYTRKKIKKKKKKNYLEQTAS